MSNPKTSKTSFKSTCFVGELFGALRCAKPDGPTTEKYGPEVAPAPVSARQAKDKDLAILVTSGLIGRDSSASVILQQSLESKLAPRLDMAGSTLFKLTWRRKTTPLGRSYLERAASALRTSDKDFTSWPSPNCGDWNNSRIPAEKAQAYSQRRLERPNACSQLADTAQALTPWPTPQTHDDKLRGNTAADNHYFPHDLSNAATLASWSTPKAEDSECAGAHRGTPDTLHSQANLAAWATSAERDYRTANLKSFAKRGGGKKGEQLQNQVKHLAGWPTPMAGNTDNRGGNPGGEARQKTEGLLAGWPTPMAGSPATENYNEAGNNDSSRKTVDLASWPTPATADDNLSRITQEGSAKEFARKDRSANLATYAQNLAAWPTPAVDSFRSRSGDRINEMGLDQMARTIPECPAGPVRLTASGEVLTGSDAEMESFARCQGQLNPALSAWLMGIPPIWDIFCFRAGEAMRFRRSSKKAKKE